MTLYQIKHFHMRAAASSRGPAAVQRQVNGAINRLRSIVQEEYSMISGASYWEETGTVLKPTDLSFGVF